MTHIFISYSHQDREYAHQVAEALEDEGFTPWIDDRIDYGGQWPMIIQEQLDNCAAFVLIMTPRSYVSPWVQNELARAQTKEKPIFPLLLEGDVWLSVQTIQYVDVRDGQLPPSRFFSRMMNYAPHTLMNGSAPEIDEDIQESDELIAALCKRPLAISTLKHDDNSAAKTLLEDDHCIWGVGPTLRRGAIVAIYIPKGTAGVPAEDRGTIRYLFSVAQDTQKTHSAIPWNHYVWLYRRVKLETPLTLDEMKADPVVGQWRLPLGNFRGVGRLKQPLTEIEKRVFWQLVLERNPQMGNMLVKNLFKRS
jgi:hypothetical protein